MERVIVVLASGDEVTWSREKDGLRDVSLHTSGALMIHCDVEKDGEVAAVIKMAYSVGVWLTWEVEW